MQPPTPSPETVRFGVFEANLGETFVVALGIGKDGRKTVLGLRQGASENATVVNELYADLEHRGLDFQQVRLYVLDGAKALANSVRKRAGEAAFLQRCQLHKRRNVLGHLPEEHQPCIEKKVVAAWAEEMKKRPEDAYFVVDGSGCDGVILVLLAGLAAADGFVVVDVGARDGFDESPLSEKALEMFQNFGAPLLALRLARRMDFDVIQEHADRIREVIAARTLVPHVATLDMIKRDEAPSVGADADFLMMRTRFFSAIAGSYRFSGKAVS